MSDQKPQQIVIRQQVKIVNKLGLHARPAAEFVRAANLFRSDIWLIKGDQRFSATSIVEVLTADLCCGDLAIIEADGPDSEEAVARLVKLFADCAIRVAQDGPKCTVQGSNLRPSD